MSRPESPPIPRREAPAFEAPWQAEAFAIVQVLMDRGVFSAPEWSAALGRERSRPGLAPDAGDYHASLLAALETLLAEKGLADPADVAACADAWHRAARATPHGRPILLDNDPGRPAR